MTLKITKQQKEKIIRILENSEELPDGYKDLLFPNQKKEYELVYAGKERKEDIIAETMAVPFQKVKTFGKNGNGWTNKLVFGDNLQVLKELYNDQRGKNLLDTKDKIKLIYIDPPFATKQDFMKNGEKVYQDKVIGAEFLEFLRERLILAREILADDGSIYVHLDQKKMHYAKVVLDEIFGENNFRNTIIWAKNSLGAKGSSRQYPKNQDNILFYTKTDNFVFNKIFRQDYGRISYKKDGKELLPFGCQLDKDGKYYQTSPPGDYSEESIERMRKEGLIEVTSGGKIRIKSFFKREGDFLIKERLVDDVWTDVEVLFRSSDPNLDYPTQKPEALLERVIKVSSNQDDIVLDFFAGSGTTLATAEKLNRLWVGCDCGKLSIYTIQKRILNIAGSKALGDKDEQYNKGPKPFTLYNAGLYDYKKIKELPWDEYRNFALNLFEVRDDKHKLSGIDLDGYRGNDHVIIFNHEKYKTAVLDYGYIDDLHKNFGSKITDRFFIIAPASHIDFLEDYVERGKVRYYILRIPYSIINELHNRDFENIKQPVDEKDVNNTVEAVGFDFIQTPDVECDYKTNKKEATIKIKKFKSKVRSKKPVKYGNLETLSMVMVDYNFDGEVFDLDKTYFAEELKKNNHSISFDKNLIDKKMMIIYMDIFGNEKREIKEIKDFK